MDCTSTDSDDNDSDDEDSTEEEDSDDDGRDCKINFFNVIYLLIFLQYSYKVFFNVQVLPSLHTRMKSFQSL